MKKIKKVVAFVAYNNNGQVLLVQRSETDNNFPNVWSLPSGTLEKEENYEKAVIRSVKEKLGIDVEIVRLIGEGEIERKKHVLHMKEYEIKIISGEISIDKNIEKYYQDWKWSDPDMLNELVEKGSLCSKIYVENTK